MISGWRHRDGGFVLHVAGRTWILEISYARRRRDKWGVRHPLKVDLRAGLRP